MQNGTRCKYKENYSFCFWSNIFYKFQCANGTKYRSQGRTSVFFCNADVRYCMKRMKKKVRIAKKSNYAYVFYWTRIELIWNLFYLIFSQWKKTVLFHTDFILTHGKWAKLCFCHPLFWLSCKPENKEESPIIVQQ